MSDAPVNPNPPELKYSEWNERGLRIHKGSKAVRFEDGEGVFTVHQVYDPTKYNLTQRHEDYLIRAQEWETMPT